ncbi:hypothetical protein DKX15_20610, partial [Enterococcus faecium]
RRRLHRTRRLRRRGRDRRPAPGELRGRRLRRRLSGRTATTALVQTAPDPVRAGRRRGTARRRRLGGDAYVVERRFHHRHRN